jgi:hypothetical protein
MSTLKADTIVASDGTSPVTLTKQSAAKAWLYAQQRTATVEAKNSLNVSSWVDDTTGKSTTNLTNAMSNTYYNILVSNSYDSDASTGNVGCDEGWPISSSQLKHNTHYSTASYYDCDFVYNSIMGDLA